MSTTKKATTIFLALLLAAGASFAQKNKKDKEEKQDPNKYKKLVDYYDKGKYADCLFTAEKWMDNDKYSKEPQIYMYASMSHLAVYKDPDAFPLKKYPEFKNPLKSSMSYFVKFRKHDKSGEAMAENKAFADELKGTVIMEAMSMHEKKDITHLTGMGRDIVKTYEKDDVMLLLGGAYLLATNNLADGLKATDSAMVSLKKRVGTQPVFTDDEQKALNEGFIVYTDYLISKKEIAKATSTMKVANEILVPNDKLKEQTAKIEKSTDKK